MKRIVALVLVSILAAFGAAGCAAEPEAAASESAAAETAAEETAAPTDAADAADSERSVEGLTFDISDDWEETDAGTMKAYSGEAAADLPFTITVAALDPELVLSAEASDTEPYGALLNLLGVESSSLQPAELKGRSAVSFTGEAENAYEVYGYAVREDSGTMFILMIQSTNVSDPDVQQVWQTFLDSVEFPGA